MIGQTPPQSLGPLSIADAERLAEIMQALASPVRLRILSVLRSRPNTVTELSEQLHLGQTTVSNHLRLLRHLSLVTGSRDGRHVHYTLFDDHVTDLLDEAIGHLEHVPRGG
ncbi:metalloregulator ArsR/SmtB family transcription factor [Microbacterium sp. 2FI]|uniref:ArsR/SmtB family transcription factor n=1 Tax=Microbacterium sp. 2FI TaxID=2502193 RepID=UPI0010F79BE0|nr:metalloregulator ArsR/SmtB family transcription factor [Microbacterium sp. 2FI]